jgi:hypothetical protein
LSIINSSRLGLVIKIYWITYLIHLFLKASWESPYTDAEQWIEVLQLAGFCSPWLYCLSELRLGWVGWLEVGTGLCESLKLIWKYGSCVGATEKTGWRFFHLADRRLGYYRLSDKLEGHLGLSYNTDLFKNLARYQSNFAHEEMRPRKIKTLVHVPHKSRSNSRASRCTMSHFQILRSQQPIPHEFLMSTVRNYFGHEYNLILSENCFVLQNFYHYVREYINKKILI